MSENSDDLKPQSGEQNNVETIWSFGEKSVGKYVADGSAHAATMILDRVTKKETGAFLVHQFEWQNDKPFITRESAFVTKLRRVGRSSEQDVNTTHAVKVNAALYSSIIVGGVLHVPKGNGEFDEIKKSADEMKELARLYPEAASEAIETWFESVKFKLLNAEIDSFDWMFTSSPTVAVLCYVGDEDDPQELCVLKFKSPTSEARENFDEEVQKIKSKKEGELNIATLSESVVRKITYGAQHLISVEGVLIGETGEPYSDKIKQRFITLFNPVSFVTAVETMHESFDFTKGKAASN